MLSSHSYYHINNTITHIFVLHPFMNCVKMNLKDAAESGDLERVQLLLGQGVDKDEADGGGFTALWNAAYKGHLAIVQHLVEQGTDKDKVSNHGTTPLHTASIQGHLEVKGQTGTKPITSAVLPFTMLLAKVI